MSQQRAVRESELVVLAVPGNTVVDLAERFARPLAGMPVADATNEYPSGTASLALAERVAAAAPQASVVKAFNTIGAERMADPVIAGHHPSMFIAGDDPSARDTISRLAADLGFEPVVAGTLERADHLENLARFWIDLSRDRGRNIGFRLLSEE